MRENKKKEKEKTFLGIVDEKITPKNWKVLNVTSNVRIKR